MERTPVFHVQPFGNYYLLERIAVGGMAEIFKAKQTGARGFEKIVVIKRILQHLSEDPEFVEMFEDEAKLAAQLNQANIVQIYELGEIAQTLYITMELVDGRNLRDLTRAASGRAVHLSIDQVVMIITETLKGLDYAHRKTDSSGVPLNIVHRDISPQNIIISYEGEVKILDFGIAKAASKISKTEAGVLKGKFSYMSPEQASGKPIDQTSDLYATGVILHELLTSDRLFRSKTDLETLDKVKEGFVAPPSEKNPQIPAELDRITLKALAKHQEDRYQSASEMLTDLLKFSFDQKYNYQSQHLSSFMKILFQDAIRDEKMRLLESLGKIPQNPVQQLQNARTHIAFKRSLDDPAQTELLPKEPKESTHSIERRSSNSASSKKNLRLIIGLLAGFAAFLYFVSGPSTKEDTSKSTPSKTISVVPPKIVDIPEPENRGSNKLDEVLLPDPSADNKPSPPPSEEFMPPARPITAPPKAAKPKPKQDRPREIVKLPAPQLEKGKVNVMAPPEGFAELFIDNQPQGTVPGPRARNIELSPGRHRVRCDTTSKSYAGDIEVGSKQVLNVRCQELGDR